MLGGGFSGVAVGGILCEDWGDDDVVVCREYQA